MLKISTHRATVGVAALAAALVMAPTLLRGGQRGPQSGPAPFSGTWFGQLDAKPFGLPPGTSLAALLAIHPDGTLMVTDPGDFGAPPISLVQTPQFGSWVRTGPDTMRATTLFFAGDPSTLDATAIKRGLFRLEVDDNDHLTGVVEIVEQINCPAGALPGFLSCPNPVLIPASAWTPEPGGAPNVPFEAWRVPVQ